MKLKHGMKYLSILMVAMFMSAVIAPVMACNPLDPDGCSVCPFATNDGMVDSTGVEFSSSELTGEERNVAVAEALADTSINNLMDELLENSYTPSPDKIKASTGVATNESMTVTTTLVAIPFTKVGSSGKAYLVFATNELGKAAQAVVAHDGMVSYLRYDPAAANTEEDSGVVCDFCKWAVGSVCSSLATTGCGVACTTLCLKPMHPAFIVICAGSCLILCEFLVAYEACNWGAQEACEGAGLC